MKRKLRVRGVTVIAFISMVVMIFCVGCGNNSDTDKSTKKFYDRKKLLILSIHKKKVLDLFLILW